MSDQTTVPKDEGPLVNKTLRALLGIGILCFCMSLIVGLLYHGKPGNSLHESSLSWAWFLILVIMITFGLANAVPSLMSLLQRLK